MMGERFGSIWNKDFGSPGEEMGRNTLGENSDELSFSVGKIKDKQRQEVWLPLMAF